MEENVGRAVDARAGIVAFIRDYVAYVWVIGLREVKTVKWRIEG